MKWDENELSVDLIHAYQQGSEAYFDAVSELTGLHVIILIDGETIISTALSSHVDADE